MKPLIYLYFLLSLIVGPFSIVSAETEIPEFTPNVVDPFQRLTKDDQEDINKTLDSLRRVGIWAAVYLTDKLNEESIESLAERAFRKWELGESKKDNGLLLVLVLDDRKSRFEVGYGLEGDFTDLLTSRVLQQVLAPEMRNGNMKGAIVNSLLALAAKGATLENNEDSGNSNDMPFVKMGWFTYILSFLALWLTRPIIVLRDRVLAQKFRKLYPELRLPTEGDMDSQKLGIRKIIFGDTDVFMFPILSFIPGIAILFLACMNLYVSAGLILTCLITISLIYYFNLKKYSSKAHYLHFIETKKKEFDELVLKGHATEVSPGNYKYTPSYLARIRSSRSGSSGSRSSSGGGRSGGGGSSSSW